MNERALTKRIFVAYAYGLYDRRDYRRVFASLEEQYGVQFIFADEKITNMQIMAKIISYIDSADFSIFDISAWNPNVTLELGVALAKSDRWYICFNPEKTELREVPSDIRGIDRIQYTSFSDLQDKLTILLEQTYPRTERRSVDEFLKTVGAQVLELLRRDPGLRVAEISEVLNSDKQIIKIALRSMVGDETVRMEGKTKGARYYVA